MWAVDVLKSSGINNKLIPVPRDLSSECGYCVSIDSASVCEVTELLKKEKIEFDRIHQID
jgi:hypothetical protein